jgi:hypothetical protein
MPTGSEKKANDDAPWCELDGVMLRAAVRLLSATHSTVGGDGAGRCQIWIRSREVLFGFPCQYVWPE